MAAGVKQQLEADASWNPGLRLLDQRFIAIHQAIGGPKNRDDAAVHVPRQFVGDTKTTGFVAASLASLGIVGASVSPIA